MKDKEYHSISKMIEYCNKCKKFIGNYSFEEFVMNDMALDAVILNISQIGELVKNISDSLKIKYPNIEWRVLKDVRNKLIHDYEGIQYRLVWNIAKNDLPKLKEDLEKILNEEG